MGRALAVNISDNWSVAHSRHQPRTAIRRERGRRIRRLRNNEPPDNKAVNYVKPGAAVSEECGAQGPEASVVTKQFVAKFWFLAVSLSIYIRLILCTTLIEVRTVYNLYF